MVWKGVMIEESLENAEIFDMVLETGYEETLLEGEDEKGVMHFHQFEISDDKKDSFVSAAKKSIKQGWYLHICNGGKMVVIFKDRIFELAENETNKIEEARNYGLSVGIIREQMPFEEIIRDPFY